MFCLQCEPFVQFSWPFCVIMQVYSVCSSPNGGYPYEVNEDIDGSVPGVRSFTIPVIDPLPLESRRYLSLWFNQPADFFSFLKVCSYRRLIESQNGLGWKGHLKIISFQLPCHGQGHLPLDQVAQSPIQPDFDHFQGWGIHSFSGQPVPVPHHPHSKEFLPYT